MKRWKRAHKVRKAWMPCLFGLGVAAVIYACGGGDNCFPAGTTIQTPTGDVPVESVKVGDEVLGYDLTAGKEVVVHVVKTYVHHHDLQLKTLTLQNGTTLEATPEHPLYSATRKAWVKAGDVQPGDTLQTRDATGQSLSAALTTVGTRDNKDDVYNFETDGPGNYYAAGILAKYY